MSQPPRGVETVLPSPALVGYPLFPWGCDFPEVVTSRMDLQSMSGTPGRSRLLTEVGAQLGGGPGWQRRWGGGADPDEGKTVLCAAVGLVYRAEEGPG